MKAMKIVVSTFVVLFSAIVVVAQPPKRGKIDPAERADRMTKQMTEQLALSDEQADQIRQILTDNFTQLEADRPQRPEPNGDQRMERPRRERISIDSTKADSLRKARVERMSKMDEQIKEVLTEEQYAKWTEQRAAMQKRRPGRPGMGDRPAPMDMEEPGAPEGDM